MRETHAELTLSESLEHASLSIRWLAILGLEQFQNMSHKSCQINFLMVKLQSSGNTEIMSEFYMNLSQGIVEIIKRVNDHKPKPIQNFFVLILFLF